MPLSKEQSVALMQKFARDDEFRGQFEKDAAGALVASGLSKELVASLDAKCVAACSLAPKAAFEALLADVDGEEFRTAMSFAVAKMKV